MKLQVNREAPVDLGLLIKDFQTIFTLLSLKLIANPKRKEKTTPKQRIFNSNLHPRPSTAWNHTRMVFVTQCHKIYTFNNFPQIVFPFLVQLMSAIESFKHIIFSFFIHFQHLWPHRSQFSRQISIIFIILISKYIHNPHNIHKTFAIKFTEFPKSTTFQPKFIHFWEISARKLAKGKRLSWNKRINMAASIKYRILWCF